MSDNFFKRVIKKPPFIFPWVALFHLFMLLYSVWSNIFSPFPSEDWIETAWAFGFARSWVFLCDLQKWAAIAYILLTMLNIALRYTLHSATDVIIYTFGFFEITILFSFFVLFYFRRFGK